MECDVVPKRSGQIFMYFFCNPPVFLTQTKKTGEWVFPCFLQDFCLYILFMTITAVAPRIMADSKFSFAVSNMLYLHLILITI